MNIARRGPIESAQPARISLANQRDQLNQLARILSWPDLQAETQAIFLRGRIVDDATFGSNWPTADRPLSGSKRPYCLEVPIWLEGWKQPPDDGETARI